MLLFGDETHDTRGKWREAQLQMLAEIQPAPLWERVYDYLDAKGIRDGQHARHNISEIIFDFDMPLGASITVKFRESIWFFN